MATETEPQANDAVSEALWNAAAEVYVFTATDWADLSEDSKATLNDQVRAVYPLIEAEVRERAQMEIARLADRYAREMRAELGLGDAVQLPTLAEGWVRGATTAATVIRTPGAVGGA